MARGRMHKIVSLLLRIKFRSGTILQFVLQLQIYWCAPFGYSFDRRLTAPPPKTPQVRVVLLICMQIHIYVDVDYIMEMIFWGGFHCIHTEVDG